MSPHLRRAAGLALVAAVCLVLSFGTTAVAAKLITGKQIKDGTVTGRDLADSSVTGLDIADRSLTADDFSGTVRGPQGDVGPRGPQGPQGSPGPAGPNGASGLQYVVAAEVVGSESTKTWAAYCPSGKKVVGGGVSSTDPLYSEVHQSAPLDVEGGWLVTLYNDYGNKSITAYAWAVCVTAS